MNTYEVTTSPTSPSTWNYRVEMIESVRKVYFVNADDKEEAKAKAKANDDCTMFSGETQFNLISIGYAEALD